MKRTNKYKLENFDRIEAENDVRMLALHDLLCGGNYKFEQPVVVQPGDIFSDYRRHEGCYRVSVSMRTNPIYMVEAFPGLITNRAKPSEVFFHDEMEVLSKTDDQGIYWLVIRYAMSKQKTRLELMEAAG